jgi:hypothetical protein
MALEKWKIKFFYPNLQSFCGIIAHNVNTLVISKNGDVIMYYAMKMLMVMIIMVESH